MDKSPIRQCAKPGCRTLTRSSCYKASDYPGTLPRYGGGLCVVCHHKDNPAKCLKCEHPLRKSDMPAEFAPGTRMHRRHGLCGPCAHVSKPVTKDPEVPPAQIEQTRRSLEFYMAQRRARLERFAA